MTRPTRRFPLLAILACLLLFIGGGMAWIYSTATTVTPPTIPTPNAWNTLTQAGSQVTGFPEAEEPTTEQWREFVAMNAEAWAQAQSAIEQDGVVEVDYSGTLSQAIENTSFHWSSIGALCSAHAEIAEDEGRYADAANLHLKLLQFSDKASRHGLTAHGMKAAAYERRALQGLKELAAKLNSEETSTVLTKLRAIRRPARDLDKTLEIETHLFLNEHGKLAGSFMRWQTRGVANQALDLAKKVDAEIQQSFDNVDQVLTASSGRAPE